MGPRAFARGDTAGGFQVHEALAKLQWGRELSPAEIPKSLPSLDFRRCASMGPRAFARGDNPFPLCYAKSNALQWGRELSPAEMGVGVDPLPAPPQASMGPRAFARGDRA